MGKLRVMHIIYNMDDGGAQRVVMNHLAAFQNDPDIEMKLFVYREPVDSIYNREIRAKGYDVQYLNAPHAFSRSRVINKLVYDSCCYRAWRAAIQEFNPDIVHVHITEYLTRVLKAIVACGVPLRFVTLHSNPYRDTGKKLKTSRRAFQSYGFIPVCITDDQIAMARDHYGITEYEILRNGIDFSAYRKQRMNRSCAKKLLGISEDTFVVLGVGRLHPIKNFPLLIEAFSKLHGRKGNSCLLIAGDGAEKERLTSCADRLGVGEKVRFLGNRDDMPVLYSAADVLGVTSDSESTSLVLLEAQAFDLRCVISAGVPREAIITNRVNQMAKDATIEVWAEALLDEAFTGEPVLHEMDYDLNATSEKLKEIYLRRWKEYETKILHHHD